MKTNDEARQQYLEARKAVRDKTNPMALLRLGHVYAKGIGTTQNNVLASYFYEKAFSMECEEAVPYIEQEYEAGTRDILEDLERHVEAEGNIPPRFRNIAEKARKNKNYGILSCLWQYIPTLYPHFDEEKAMADILDGRDTIDADIYCALSTEYNKKEINIALMDSMLQQLFAPVTQDSDLMKRIKESNDTSILHELEREVILCITNISTAYDEIAGENKITDDLLSGNIEVFPYITVATLASLRRQSLRRILLLKDKFTVIKNDFLPKLGHDEGMLKASENIDNESLKLLLCSHVELNIDINFIEEFYQSQIKAIRLNTPSELTNIINDFASRLTEAGIKYNLPHFTPENLPPINI